MKRLIGSISILFVLIIVGCESHNMHTEPSYGDFVTIPKESSENSTEVRESQPPTKSQYNIDMGEYDYYSLAVENFDLQNNKEKYLLWVELAPEWVEVRNNHIGDYFVDVKEASNTNMYYEIYSASIIPENLKLDNGMIRRFSENGKLVLILNRDVERDLNSIEIFDLINKKVIYFYESNDTFIVSINSSFDFMVIDNYEEECDYLVSINDNKTTNIKLPDYSLNTVVSPDGTEIATIDYYNVNTVTILVYDVLSGNIIKNIPFGDEIPELTQWHGNKLVYSTKQGSYLYDLTLDQAELVGEYFYEPLLSPDGQYIAFVRHEEADDYFPLYENDHSLYQKCGYKEGLYVKNLSNGEITQVAPYYRYETQIYKQSPVQWIYVDGDFDNNKYRCFQEQEQEKYIDVAVSSSYLDRFFADNVLDGDTSTAWVEAEEKYIQEKENDGKGIGEWIKLYRVEHSLKYGLNYSKSFIISGIRLINGYAKSEDTYKANNRVKTVEVILTDGTSYIFDLKDDTLDFQTLDFGKEVETRDVTIKILDIYEGTKYNDTCISEVQLIEAE